MKLFERLKINSGRLAIESRLRSYTNALGTLPRPGRKGSATYMFRASNPCGIALAAYLNDDHALCRQYASEAVTNELEWFYGSWRHDPEDKTDPMWRKGRSWIDDYRQGVFWATVLGDWVAARRLSEYPGEDCIENSDRKSEVSWYLLLASYLRQTGLGNDAKTAEHIDLHASATLPDPEPPAPEGTWLAGILFKPTTFEELIEHGSRKRVKLLAKVLQAIYQREQPRFEEALVAYLNHYRKNEFSRSEAIDEKQSLDGTILYHVAKHAGLVVALPKELSDYVVRL